MKKKVHRAKPKRTQAARRPSHPRKVKHVRIRRNPVQMLAEPIVFMDTPEAAAKRAAAAERRAAPKKRRKAKKAATAPSTKGKMTDRQKAVRKAKRTRKRNQMEKELRAMILQQGKAVAAPKKVARKGKRKKTAAIAKRPKTAIRKGRPRGVRQQTLMLPHRPHKTSKPVKHGLYRLPSKSHPKKAGKRAHRFNRYTVRYEKNPGASVLNSLVSGALGFGTVLGIRALNHYIEGAMAKKDTAAAAATNGFGAAAVAAKTAYSFTDLLLAVATPALLTVGAAYLKPKAGKAAGLVDAVQFGAAFSLFENLTAGVIKLTDKDGTTATSYKHLVPGLGEYVRGLGEYVQDPMAYVPVGGTFDVRPIDSYEADPGNAIVRGQKMGDDTVVVEEALAEDDAAGLQTGYAEGSLARTVFSV